MRSLWSVWQWLRFPLYGVIAWFVWSAHGKDTSTFTKSWHALAAVFAALLSLTIVVRLWSAAALWIHVVRVLTPPAWTEVRVFESVAMARRRHIGRGHRDSWLWLLLVAAGYLIALGIWYLFTGSSVPLWIAVALVLNAIPGFAREVAPPTVCFLASSSTQSDTLATYLRHAVAPGRVVTLLEVARTTPVGERLRAREDTYRTAEGLSWQRVVEFFSAAAALIVVDSRGESEHLNAELRHLCESGKSSKAIVIDRDDVPDTGEDERARAWISPSGASIPSLSVGAALAYAQWSTRKRSRLPSPDKPTQAWLMEARPWSRSRSETRRPLRFSLRPPRPSN